jgi:hypothetical protein
MIQDFVPMSFGLPMQVESRPGFPDGILCSIEDFLSVFFDGREEIPNPDPLYQPE